MKKGLSTDSLIEYYNSHNPELYSSLKRIDSFKRFLRAEEKNLLKLVPLNACVLEIGAGSGRIIDLLDNGERKITGIDIADISSLKKKYQNDPNVRVINMDAKKLNFEKNSFDVCTIMSNTLGLFKDPSEVLNECIKVTKPRGKIILSTYEKDAEYVLNERKKYFIKTGHKIEVKGFEIKIKNGVCVRYFTFDEIDKIFKKTGLEFKYSPLTKLGCLWVAEVS